MHDCIPNLPILRQEKIQIQIKRSGEGCISAENGLVAETAEIVAMDWPCVIVGSTPNSSGTWGKTNLWLLRIHWDGDGGYQKMGGLPRRGNIGNTMAIGQTCLTIFSREPRESEMVDQQCLDQYMQSKDGRNPFQRYLLYI